MAEDAEGSQASQAALNPSGFKPELRILRSFGVLRRLRLRLRASGSLRMTALVSRGMTATNDFVLRCSPMPRFTFPDTHGDLLGAHISTKGGLHTVFERATEII